MGSLEAFAKTTGTSIFSAVMEGRGRSRGFTGGYATSAPCANPNCTLCPSDVEVWSHCTMPECMMCGKWMHEECWAAVHLIPGHTKCQETRCSSLAEASICTTLAEYTGVD